MLSISLCKLRDILTSLGIYDTLHKNGSFFTSHYKFSAVTQVFIYFLAPCSCRERIWISIQTSKDRCRANYKCHHWKKVYSHFIETKLGLLMRARNPSQKPHCVQWWHECNPSTCDSPSELRKFQASLHLKPSLNKRTKGKRNPLRPAYDLA